MEIREKLINYSYMYDGNWVKISKALSQNVEPDLYPNDCACLTIYDSAYPDALRKLRYPPWVLFYRGDITLLTKPMISVVGSRQATGYGLMATEWVCENLCDGYVIVSGLAKGVDACAHRTTMNLGGRTIGVIGSGLNTQYPAANKEIYNEMEKHQLILSEYPPDTGIKKGHFPWRNRILAALGDAIFVTQATYRSGTMLTVNEGLELSKEIYCIPYPLGNEQGAGCNALIEQGANILYRPEQLKDLLKGKKSLYNSSCKMIDI